MIPMQRSTGGVADPIVRLTFWSVAAGMLLVPLIAMQFTREVNWGGEDFIFASGLIGLAGIAFEATMRLMKSWTYRFAAGFAVAAIFLTVWANAAVGMIGEGANPYNLLFVTVAVLAIAAAIAGRFRASNMSLIMLMATVAYVAVAAAGSALDPLGALFSGAFAGLWLISAVLFRKAAMDKR